MAKAAKEKHPVVVTAVGILSFPWITKPDVGRTYSDGKFKTDLFIRKEDFMKDLTLYNTTLSVGRKHFGQPKWGIKDFANPIKDVELMPLADRDKLPELLRSGFIRIRAKSQFAPTVYGPVISKGNAELSAEEAAAIKGGDFARLVVAVYPYDQKEGGVTFGLNALQYWRKGESLGQGKGAALGLLSDFEVTMDDIPAEDDAEDKEVSFG